MFQLEYSGQFRKDLKKIAKQGLDVNKLTCLLKILEIHGQVPQEYRPHVLSGNYSGFWECHIQPDWLLIYDIQDTVKIVRLVRSGSHSDLFKK